jgi:hypothetical protein
VSTRHVPIHRGLPNINLWLVAVVGLVAALVGLTAWVLVDRTTSSSTVSATGSTPGLASPEVVTMLKNRIAAVNSGDATAVSKFYSQDGVLEERDVTPAAVTKGSEQIGSRIHGLATVGMQLQSASPVIRLGNTVAEAVKEAGATNAGWILVYSLDPNGKLGYQWVLPAG